MRTPLLIAILSLAACDALGDQDVNQTITSDPDADTTSETDPSETDPSETDGTDSDSADSDTDFPVPIDNNAPVAHAGPDQADVLPGTTVELDGSASYDPDAGQAITYAWSFTSVPTGSGSVLANASRADAFFFADVDGTYQIRLEVSDGIDVASDSVTVTVTEDNLPPIADAGSSRSASIGTAITLSGAASYDPDGTVATYTWSLISQPPSSTASLLNASTVSPSFTVDVAGAYVAQLIVTDDDGLLSYPAVVTVTAQDDSSSDDCLDCSAEDMALQQGWTAGRAGTSLALLLVPMLFALLVRREDD